MILFNKIFVSESENLILSCVCWYLLLCLQNNKQEQHNNITQGNIFWDEQAEDNVSIMLIYNDEDSPLVKYKLRCIYILK